MNLGSFYCSKFTSKKFWLETKNIFFLLIFSTRFIKNLIKDHYDTMNTFELDKGKKQISEG